MNRLISLKFKPKLNQLSNEFKTAYFVECENNHFRDSNYCLAVLNFFDSNNNAFSYNYYCMYMTDSVFV